MVARLEQLEMFPPRLTQGRVTTIARRLVIIGFPPDAAHRHAIDVLRATWVEGQTTRAWTKAAVALARERRT